MKTLKEKIEIMQAALDGESIDVQDDGWITVDDPVLLDWNWELTNYRVTPKPIECWVNVLNGDLCSTVDRDEDVAKGYLGLAVDSSRWTTRKFREVIE